MELTEQKIAEALGVELPGAEEQESAAPAAEEQNDTAPAGGEEQEVTEPAGETGAEDEEAENGDDDAEENESEDATDPKQKEEQSAKERKANAARRRKAERQAAIDKAVADTIKAQQAKQEKELQAVFNAAGLKNTFTGKPITNMDELQEWRQAFESQKLEKDLAAGKLTPEGLQHVIDQNPIIQQARQIINGNEERQKQEADAKAREQIEKEIQEIHEIDPTINSAEDLMKMPEAKEFYDKVSRGYSFRDAHELVTRHRLENARNEAARQQMEANIRGKDHLGKPGRARGTGAVAVPAEQLKYFRTLNPKATDAQILAYYNKYNNK